MVEKMKRPKNTFREETKQEEFGKDLKNYIYNERSGKFFKQRRVEVMSTKEKAEFEAYQQAASKWKENVRERKAERVNQKIERAKQRTEKRVEKVKNKEIKGLSRKIMKEEVGRERKKARLSERAKIYEKKIAQINAQIKSV